MNVLGIARDCPVPQTSPPPGFALGTGSGRSRPAARESVSERSALTRAPRARAGRAFISSVMTGADQKAPCGGSIAGACEPAAQLVLPAGVAADPVALFRAVVSAALAWGGQRQPGCGPDCVLGCGGAGRSAMFWAVAGQVRAVREFVRQALPGHPAAGDTVSVASELAANTVAHSRSGWASGVFTVHVLAMGTAAAALTVTELRGEGYPQVRDPATGMVPGRGLAVVQALTSVFWVADTDRVRILLATIPAPPPGRQR